MRVNEQGRSMIEMLGVLAIVGVLSVGGIAGYSKAMNKFKTNKVIDQINMISTNIRTLYSSQRNYNGLNNQLAKKAGAVSGDMFSSESNDTITNAFQGKITILTGNHNGQEDAAYIIGFDGLPKAACVAAATTDWGGDVGSGFAAMIVSGTGDGSAAAAELKGSDISAKSSIAIPGDPSNGTPMSIVNAQTSCSNNANNAIALKYI
ncbi:MAG: hypothetical protein E7005_05975 [Alphaproteobacteria bacterium]|nr:hypothetical protein [Alphaproteobacteria bacterium]